MEDDPVFQDGNRLTLLETGQAYFPALRAAILGAVDEVFLESYLFQDDPLGRDIAAALRAAAMAGVQVRMLVDGFGSAGFVRTLMPELQAAGVEVLVYRRERKPFSLRRHRLRRLHRKLAVVDGRVAFVGGINIIDDFDSLAPEYPRHDYAVQVEGPLLVQRQSPDCARCAAVLPNDEFETPVPVRRFRPARHCRRQRFRS